jgi:hypothetical protein
MGDLKRDTSFALRKRLDEIDGQLTDIHISTYKSDLLYKEKDKILEELNKRGWKNNLGGK